MYNGAKNLENHYVGFCKHLKLNPDKDICFMFYIYIINKNPWLCLCVHMNDNTQFIITMNLNYDTFLLHVCFINVCTVFHV